MKELSLTDSDKQHEINSGIVLKIKLWNQIDGVQILAFLLISSTTWLYFLSYMSWFPHL